LARRIRRLAAAGLGLLVLLSACAGGGENPTGPAHLLLTELYMGGPMDANQGQFLRLFNPTASPVKLDGWTVGDGSSWAQFPPGALLTPGASFYLAHDPLAFQRAMGMPPDLIWGGGPGVAAPAAGPEPTAMPQVAWMVGGEALKLKAEGGWIGLRGADGAVIDAVAWGAAPAERPSWKGAPAPAPQPGEILDRGRLESAQESGTLAYTPDTDTAADWKHGGDWVDRRVYRPGQTWFGAPRFRPARVTAYTAPDSAYAVVTGLIDGARERIDLEIYDFTLVPLAEKLAAAAQRGVKVRLLMDAGSVGRLSDQERWVAARIAAAGGEVRWILNDVKNGYPGRYVYDHSKWGVIDGRRAFVQSENFVRHGTPVDSSFGNRGWGVAVEDVAFAGWLSRVFEADWRQEFGDVQRFGVPPFGGPKAGFQPETGTLTGHYPTPFQPLTLTSGVMLTPVLAPEHALLESGGISGLIRSARSSVLIEQQYIYPHWGPNGGDPVRTPDLYLEEAIRAARRGVKVRILLSDAFQDEDDPKDNGVTVAYVNGIAARERLDLAARIINSKAAGLDKIHNKGVVVDDQKVLVSSINWSYNSPANNRELGVVLESPVIGRYFADVFQYDWGAGRPSDQPLLTLVDREAGVVAITNPTGSPQVLTGWALTAAAGRWSLPNLTIPANGVVTVAPAGAGEGEHAALLPNFRLRPEGDRLRLLQGNREVDSVDWGSDARYWRAPLPAGTALLCRMAPFPDTNTPLDWRSGGHRAPGQTGCAG
jgi:cardiolipin synthase